MESLSASKAVATSCDVAPSELRVTVSSLSVTDATNPWTVAVKWVAISVLSTAILTESSPIVRPSVHTARASPSASVERSEPATLPRSPITDQLTLAPCTF